MRTFSDTRVVALGFYYTPTTDNEPNATPPHHPSMDHHPTCEDIDAELRMLLLDDDDDDNGGADCGIPRAPPPLPNSKLLELAETVQQLEARVLALENLLGDALNAFESLATQRLERAAMDAAHAVSHALAEAVVGTHAEGEMTPPASPRAVTQDI